MTTDTDYMRLFRIKKTALFDYAKPPSDFVEAALRRDEAQRELHDLLRPETSGNEEGVPMPEAATPLKTLTTTSTTMKNTYYPDPVWEKLAHDLAEAAQHAVDPASAIKEVMATAGIMPEGCREDCESELHRIAA
ncbi:hypothetical protein [Salipiger bermudensis]|uniref:hypothetical protein n=1 Tax=Salipiger bermudensis TaxID=344736 RepID=UPI001CD389E1|nr:hypothetical protein [Salipiger bermudensis]MCA1288219.1 hypothetical protein [Salipiger bermudensis]